MIDKIPILEIKSERITDAAKRHHVGTELAAVVAARDRAVPGSVELARLATAAFLRPGDEKQGRSQ